MKLSELKQLQFNVSKSYYKNDLFKSEVYLDIIKEFEKNSAKEYSEEVKISRIAEKYKERMLRNFNLTKNKDYKLKAQAANTLTIDYLTQSELSKLLEINSIKNGASKSLVIELLEKANLLWRCPAEVIDFAFDLMSL